MLHGTVAAQLRAVNLGCGALSTPTGMDGDEAAERPSSSVVPSGVQDEACQGEGHIDGVSASSGIVDDHASCTA
jgi:hypothetical protein